MSLDKETKRSSEENMAKERNDEIMKDDSEDLFEDYYKNSSESNNYSKIVEDKNVNSTSFQHSSNPDESKNLPGIRSISASHRSVGAALPQLNSNLKLPKITIGSVAAGRPRNKVFVRWPLIRHGYESVVPQPHPERSIKDRWDENHVRMPCSTQSQFPVANSEGIKVLKNRWELIEKSLSNPIRNAKELEDRIMSYNRSGRWNFDGFEDRFSDEESMEYDTFFNKILPEMCALALRLPFVITAPIPLLRRGCNLSVTFSQHQIASLLANAFFCTFPRRNATGRQTEYSNFPIINFNRLFSTGDVSGEKLSCLINYFRRVTQGQSPKGVVTFTRRSLLPSQIPCWKASTKRLPQLRITSEGTIEDNGTGMLQVSFDTDKKSLGAVTIREFFYCL